MQADQATMMCEFLLPQVEYECSITKKVIAAAPADKCTYAPDPVSKPALDLAWHIASSEVWFLESMAKGAFGPDEMPMPETVKTPADVVAWYEPALQAGIAKVKAMTPEQLAADVGFFGMPPMPMVTYLQFLLKHSVHHRGQLSAYLRSMGGKVPGIYGGSADEPFEMAAAE